MKTSLITVAPKQKIRLREIDPDATGECSSKEEAIAELVKLRERMSALQEALYAQGQHSLLIILQAMDTGGKDGAVKNMMTGIDPAGVQVTSFKPPTQKELQHDFLWRVHQTVPPRGIIGVWNRSHYEDVLIARVQKLVEKKVWEARFDDINNFEKLLINNQTTILKFFLYISKDEQKRRLQASLQDPQKLWKFHADDLKERARWDDYIEAYEDAINRCSTSYAPWYIVPANRKWARNLTLTKTVVEALEAIDPQYPKPEIDAEKIVID